MKLTDKQVMLEAIKEADLVLIGIGEEWGVSFDDMLKDAVFATDFAKLETEEDRNRFVPVLQREYLKSIKNS